MTNVEGEKLRRLVDQAKAGDSESFAVLYNWYLKPIYRFIFFKIGGQKEEAEDLTQAVFLKAYAALADFNNEQNSFSAWLYRIARNAVIDFFKKKKSVTIDEEDYASVRDETDNPEEEASLHNDGDIIKRALKDLPPDQQEVIMMKFFQELSNKEIAKLLRKTEDNVRQLQSRAIKQLRIVLKGKIYG